MEEFNKTENKTKEKHWIKRHPVWSGMIGVVIFMFVMSLGDNSEETKTIKEYQCTDNTFVSNPGDCPKVETLKEELSLSLQKEIYLSFWELQYKIDYEDDKYEEKTENVYSVVAESFNISVEELDKILVKGGLEQWPLPIYDEVEEVIEDTEEEIEPTDVEVSGYESIIKENCEKDWGNDFSMRSWCEDQQLDAYEELFDIQPYDVPNDIFNTIKEDCEDDWYNDFSMQVWCIENQINGWREIQ